MDKKENDQQLSHMIDSPVSSISEISDIDVTVTPSVTSSATGYSPSSASMRASAAVPSDEEYRYQLVGNISVINQLYALSIEKHLIINIISLIFEISKLSK